MEASVRAEYSEVMGCFLFCFVFVRNGNGSSKINTETPNNKKLQLVTNENLY